MQLMHIIFLHLHVYMNKLKTNSSLPVFMTHTQSTETQYFAKPFTVSHVKLLYHVIKPFKPFNVIG